MAALDCASPIALAIYEPPIAAPCINQPNGPEPARAGRGMKLIKSNPELIRRAVPPAVAPTVALMRILIPSKLKSFKSPKQKAIIKVAVACPLSISSFNFRMTLSTASGADFLAFAKGEFRLRKSRAPRRAIKRSFSIARATPFAILFQIRFFIIFFRLFDREKLGRVGGDDLIFCV